MSQPTHRLTDERLCWLAVRSYCEQRSRKRGLMRWIGFLSRAQGASAVGGRSATSGPIIAGDIASQERREQMSDKLGDYAMAVDDAARTLTTDERARLRETGQVPDWFLTDVERRFAELRRKN